MCKAPLFVPLCLYLTLNFTSCKAPTDGTNVGDIDPCEELDCALGGIIRGSDARRDLALVFTGDEFADGAAIIREALQSRNIKAAFFLTGNFYRNPAFSGTIRSLREEGHYLGAHSDRHLLYCDWDKRDSLLVTRQIFMEDLNNNYREMARFDVSGEEAPFYLPPYEWYNDTISQWTREAGLQLINYTSGTISHADYTTPDMTNYRSSEEIFRSIVDYEQASSSGLNGFILLSHIGVSPERQDKFYHRLGDLLDKLMDKGYRFKRIDRLLIDSGPK